MFPDQQNQQGGQPQYGAAPAPVQPQQAANGQYEVLPPLPTGQNNGHTGHNPYEFIVNPAGTPKKAGFTLGGSFGKQIAVLVGGVVVLMIVAAVVLSALAPKSITPDLTAIAQRQQEIVRVASAASETATSQDAKNFALTTQLSVSTSQQQVLSYLAKHHTTLKPKVLALDQSSQTDTLLANAQNAGTYDSVVVSNLSDQLKVYESLLQKTYKAASNKTAKQVLQTSFSTADKLLGQAKNISGPSN